MSSIVAASDWPEAAIAITGALLVGAVVVVAAWQGLSTWRARFWGSREAASRELAEQPAREQAETAARVQQTRDEVRELRERGGGRP